MGGGPDKEHLLIAMWFPEPKHIIAEIKRRFPYFDITYFQFDMPKLALADRGSLVPKELFKSATILITLGVLPPQPEDAPNLKLIHLFSAGVDRLTTHPILTKSNIDVTTSSGIHGPPISEWILQTSLAASKHFAIAYEWQKKHQWGGEELKVLAEGTDWVGKRVGIAGYGSIGRQVARVFTALGAEVVAYTAGPRNTAEERRDHGYIVPRTGDPDGTFPVAWFSGTTKESLHTFLRAGLDSLVISLPLTPATTHLFSTAEFEILRGAFIVNISRGKIIDQPALVAALNQGILRGAALDVADPEPLPADDPLWTAKNAIITPHISGLGREYADRAYDVFITNWARKERGKKMVNLVDRKKGY